jgi:hypothetical protein
MLKATPLALSCTVRIRFRSRGKCERFAFRFDPKKKLSKFIKLNLLVFVRDRGKCERFGFRFEPKKM